TRTADRNAVVYRPELRAPTRPVKAQAQKIDERHPVVQHNDIAAPVSHRASRDAYRPAQNTSPNYRLGRPESTRPTPERTPQPSKQRDAAPRENRPDSHNAPSSASAPQANRNPESVARSNPNRNPEPVVRSNPSPYVEQPTRTVPPGQARQGEARGRQP